MTELFDAIASWQTSILVVVAFGFMPGFILRLLVKIYPHKDPRRQELVAELYAMKRIKRPLFVAEQLETVLFEGIPQRARALHPSFRKHTRRTQAWMANGGLWEAVCWIGAIGGIVDYLVNKDVTLLAIGAPALLGSKLIKFTQNRRRISDRKRYASELELSTRLKLFERLPHVDQARIINTSNAMLAKGGRVVVYGDVGVGKTTMLGFLTVALLRNPAARLKLTPVPLDLTGWNSSPYSFRNFIATEIARTCNLSPSRARKVVEEGKIVPLIDALDEQPTHERELLLQAIEREWTGRPIVLTSRPFANEIKLSCIESYMFEALAAPFDHLRSSFNHPCIDPKKEN